MQAFADEFQGWARRVRLRLGSRRVLTGASYGALAGVLAAAAAWALRRGELRPWAAVLAVLGALFGWLYARRARWSDSDVALYLDGRLESDESISTAVELRSRSAETSVADVILARATAALRGAAKSAARPRVLRRLHVLAPLSLAAVVWLSLIALPKAPPSPALAPGAELVKKPGLKGLDRIEALEKLRTSDALQHERLAKIAEDAKRLRRDLAQGLEKREAQARVAKLRDQIGAERLKLGDGQNRAGLEAAIGKLERTPSTRGAAKALGDADLTEFDREMQELANKAEQDSRKGAKRALEEAAKAARERGAEKLARALEEQRKLFEEREANAGTLRELAAALGDKLSEQAREDLREFGQSGNPDAQRRLTESLNKALKGLSPEERRQLLENLSKRLSQNKGQLEPMTAEQLEALGKRLSSREGQQALEEMLKQLAQAPTGDEVGREQGLDDADRGGADAERELGIIPLPMPSPGGAPGKDGKGSQGQQKSSAGPGSHHDEGQGSHGGQSDAVSGPELRAKAGAHFDPRAPMHGSTLGRSDARPGETAKQKGLGALGSAGSAEAFGVEGAEVPEEYREQVGRYFQP